MYNQNQKQSVSSTNPDNIPTPRLVLVRGASPISDCESSAAGPSVSVVSSTGNSNNGVTTVKPNEWDSAEEVQKRKLLLSALEECPEIWNGNRRNKPLPEKWRYITRKTQLPEVLAKEYVRKIKSKIEYRVKAGIKDKTINKERFILERDSSLKDFYNKHRFEHWNDAKFLTNIAICKLLGISSGNGSEVNAATRAMAGRYGAQSLTQEHYQQQPASSVLHQQRQAPLYNELLQGQAEFSSIALQGIGRIPRKSNAPATFTTSTAMAGPSSAIFGGSIYTTNQEHPGIQLQQTQAYETMMVDQEEYFFGENPQQASNPAFPEFVSNETPATPPPVETRREQRHLHGYHQMEYMNQIQLKTELQDEQASNQYNPLRFYSMFPDCETALTEDWGLTQAEYHRRVLHFKDFKQHIEGTSSHEALEVHAKYFEKVSLIANYLALDEKLPAKEVEKKLNVYIARLRSEI